MPLLTLTLMPLVTTTSYNVYFALYNDYNKVFDNITTGEYDATCDSITINLILMPIVTTI
jgi:hypothetical protein